jgi:hypothetical protein
MSDQPWIVQSVAALRSHLMLLRARHDNGAVSPAVYRVIRDIEIDIAWAEYESANRRAYR